MSRDQPTVVHINIVSPLASQHAPYRHCDVYGHTSDDAALAAIDGLTVHPAYAKLAACSINYRDDTAILLSIAAVASVALTIWLVQRGGRNR